MSRDECRKCGAHGHWWGDCPQSQQQSPGETSGGVGNTSAVRPVAQREYETYLEAEVRGKMVSFLLDSGCCTNILPIRMVDLDEIKRNPSKLLAANKSPIEVIGTVTWELPFGKQTVPIKFDVSRVIDEPILGIGFLFDCECDWNFADRKIKIAGEIIPLQERRAQMPVRRIYASQPI